MAFTYDLGTDVGKVRLIISDIDEGNAANQIFQDEEIQVFLGMEGGQPTLAAAMAFETMGGNETQIQKRIRIMDLSLDGPAVSVELRALAKSLRDRYQAILDAADTEPSFAVAGVY